MRLINLFEKASVDVYTPDIVKQIKSQCQDFLKPENFTLLYRGMKGYGTPSQLKNVRLSGRKPLDMDPIIHKNLVAASVSEYGKSFRDGLFVTTDSHQALSYGDLHVIFPVGKFEYVWSPTITDLFDFLDKNKEAISTIDKIEKLKDVKMQDREFEKYFRSVYKKHYKHNTGLSKSKGEVVIRCEKYIAVDVDYIENVVKQLF